MTAPAPINLACPKCDPKPTLSSGHLLPLQAPLKALLIRLDICAAKFRVKALFMSKPKKSSSLKLISGGLILRIILNMDAGGERLRSFVTFTADSGKAKSWNPHAAKPKPQRSKQSTL